MLTPQSIENQIARLEKFLLELKTADVSDKDQVSVLVADICNSSILLLDKAMNKIWEKKSNPAPEKKKPKIYFPICRTEEDLLMRVRQYQMPSLRDSEPKLYDLLASAQPFRGVSWLSQSHRIASIRHNDFPKISTTQSSGIAIGAGQNLHIERLTVDANGNMNFTGTAKSQVSGKVEPVKVDYISKVHAEIEDIRREPFSFCRQTVRETSRLARKIYHQL